MQETVTQAAARAKVASRFSARQSPGVRDAALVACAELIEARAPEILAANAADLVAADAAGTSKTLLDRLALSPARVAAMAVGLRGLAAQPDPVGAVVDGWSRPNGLSVRRVRVPLGVVAVIYEARPNVTADAAGLAIRSGNAAVLRGSSIAQRSNMAIAGAISEALVKVGLPSDAVVLVEDTSREGAIELLRCAESIDCLIPRGGESLIATVRQHATVPVVMDGAGNCHIFVDASADAEMAVSIVGNAKCSRPGVCNAAETVLVHSQIAESFLPRLEQELSAVELRADPRALRMLASASPATEADWETEYLDYVLAVGVVDSLDQAIEHIGRYGTGHSEAIVTADIESWKRFSTEVDAAAVLLNASTRFVDGGELGFGAEIGISTQKLHVRGPMGAEALTCVKLVIEGEGQVRR